MNITHFTYSEACIDFIKSMYIFRQMASDIIRENENTF